MTPTQDPFLAEAVRIGLQLCRAALRDGGRATWLADEMARREGYWQRTVRTLEGTVAEGTAGVGWFLGRLAPLVGSAEMAGVAIEAIRHALDRSGLAVGEGRLGWYSGSLGVAWVAIDAGAALGSDELIEAGTHLARESVAASGRIDFVEVGGGLVGGASDVLGGILGVASSMGEPQLLHPGEAIATRLAAVGSPDGSTGLRGEGRDTPPAGMAGGRTGIALVLANWASATGDPLPQDWVRRVIRDERRWYQPAMGWLTLPAHPWLDQSANVDVSWCAGAAGIGAARIGLYSVLAEMAYLADLSAAIELERAALAADAGTDASLCHGTAGAIDLLISAGAILAEPSHIAAARAAGVVLMQRASGHGRYHTSIGADAQNASLLYGLAGTGLLMLRLSDGGLTPTPTLPPFLVATAAGDSSGGLGYLA